MTMTDSVTDVDLEQLVHGGPPLLCAYRPYERLEDVCGRNAEWRSIPPCGHEEPFCTYHRRIIVVGGGSYICDLCGVEVDIVDVQWMPI